MKPIHLLCHVEAYQSMDLETFQKYSMLESDKENPTSKWQEEDDLLLLVDELKKAGLQDFKDFDQYYFGYIIEHISKEFDLLRIGENFSINIELKHQSSQEKVLKQLRLNQYYLKSVFSHVHYFTYVVNTGTLYQFVDNQLVVSDLMKLVRLIQLQTPSLNIDLDALFEPSKFLVSPFTQTKDFIEDRYFLTNQQQDFKSKIINLIEEEQPYIGIEGMAGTGKTLLLYDLAKNLKKQYHIALLHIGKLCQGQLDLKKDGYHIYPIDDTVSLDKYDIIFIDEAQRLSKEQLLRIQDSKTMCIFAYDSFQSTDQHIQEFIPKKALFKLSNHIRINPKIMQFITQFFDYKNKNIPLFNDHIEIQYFHDCKVAHSWLTYSKQLGFEILDETFEGAKHSDEIIGMAYEKIAVILDERFKMTQGKIDANDSQELSLLYLRLTRAKNKIRIAIINNPPVLEYCMNILIND